MKEFNLSERFNLESGKIEAEVKDELTKAHCHTTINTLEKDTKEFIEKVIEYLDKECSIVEGYPITEIKKLAGKRFA